MEDDVIHNVMSKRGCHLGMVADLATMINQLPRAERVVRISHACTVQ